MDKQAAIPFQRGIRKALEKETPFLLGPVEWLAKKVIGEKAVRDIVWKVQSPILKTDMALGTAAQKAGKALFGKGKSSIFSQKMGLPLKKAKGSYTGNVEVEVPSILAPVSTTAKVVMPILGAVKLEEILKKRRERKNEQ